MEQKSYNQYCGLAYALDIVGERWTILVLRELMAGPRRFKDLLGGLPGISTNLLTERLKRLEQRGIILRRVLPPPSGAAVYELTPLGQGLEPALIELGRWGSQFVPAEPGEASVLGAGSYALTLKTFFRPELARGLHETYELRIGGDVVHAMIDDGRLQVRQGESHPATATFHSDPATYLELLAGKQTPQQALAQGTLAVSGQAGAIDRFLAICGIGAPSS